MAYKCSICSFIDVNAKDTPEECVSCGAAASMSHVNYEPKTSVNHVPTTDPQNQPGADERHQKSQDTDEPIEGTLGDVFGE